MQSRTLVKERRWQIAPADPLLQKELAEKLKISLVTAQVLINRGNTTIKSAEDFLNKDLAQLHDPFLLEGMDKACNRILQAARNKEKITIYGDYDTDGICSTALLLSVLKDLGANCDYYLPNRQEEGYGLNKEALNKCREKGTQLLISVDCGISSCHEVAHANSLGMEVIVTDHHRPVGDLPPAYCLLNPKITGCKYPYPDLAGVGVVFKLAQALKTDPRRHLDLVALGTIADIVPINGENRILTHHGLELLKETKKIGLRKLKEIVGIHTDLQTGHVAFRLAPRLNASGRLSTAENSIRLLLATEEKEAVTLSQILNQNNWDRQKLEQRVLEEALEQAERKMNFNEDKVIVLANENWPVGVIGIVASRLVNRYHRPAIVISLENGIGKGSCRSIKSFHLLNALQHCQDHFMKFGGHAYAAGLNIEEVLIPSFGEKINSYANSVLKNEDLIPQIYIDCPVDFSDISFDFIEEMEKLAPFGYNNPKPVFISENLDLHRDPIIVGKNHLKLWLKASGRALEAIGFGMGERIGEFDEYRKITLAYRPQINTWQNRQMIQLHIEDMRLK